MPLNELIELLDRIFNYPLIKFQRTEITLSAVVGFTLVMVIFIVLARVLKKLLIDKLLSRFPLSNGTLDSVSRVMQLLVILLGARFAFQFIGFDLSVVNSPLFTIKDTPVTLASLLMFAVVIGVFVVISRLLGKVLLNNILAKTHIDEGTRYSLTRITQHAIMFIGSVVAFQFIGIDLSGLVVIFGLLSVGIGFGLQNITSNFVAGLILLFERPIKVGDRVTVGDQEGDVVEINIRSTTIRTLNNVHIIVPNSEFVSSTVVNWTYADPKVRLEVMVGVSYDSDLDKVLRCLNEVAQEHPEVLQEPAPEVFLTEFGDSAWNMQLRAWIPDPKARPRVTSEINCAIVRKFRANDIEIPFPQRDLHVRSPLPLPLLAQNGQSRSEGVLNQTNA